MFKIPKIWKKSVDVSIILILIASLIFRGVLAYLLYPSYDESYYYIYSHELDWSYFDHPLLVALSTGFGPWLSGIANQFTIRWGALLLYTGSLWLLYLTGKKLFNPEIAKLTLILASINPVLLLVFGTFTFPDAPLIFFWSASFYCAVSEFFRFAGQSPQTYRPTYRLAILGILVGLACLSKYHGFFLGLGFVIFCLTLSQYRAVFRSGWLWLGLGLFILTLFPLLYWNSQHDWISFQFHFSNRLTTSKHFNVLGVFSVFLTSSLTMFPPLGLLMWWIIGKNLWQQIPTFLSGKAYIRRSDLANRQWLILCVSVPLIIIFSLAGGYQHIALGWALPSFWIPTLLLGYWMSQQSKRWTKRWLKSSVIVIASLLLLTLLHLNFGIFQKPSHYGLFGGIVSPEQDISTEVLDIEQLQQAFAESPVFSTALSNSQFIFTNIYIMGGLIDLAIHPLKPIPVTCFCEDLRGFTFWTNPQEWLGKNGLFITTRRFFQDPEMIDDYRSYFQEFQKLGDIPIKRGGVTIEVFSVYQGKGFLKVYPQSDRLYKTAVISRKKQHHAPKVLPN
jgi:hypothetical protein